MSDRGPICPLCGDECKSRNHVRQHLHTHHRKFELIDVCVGGADDDAAPRSGNATVDDAERTVAPARPQ